MTQAVNGVQNGILPSSLGPSPNLRGIEGFRLRFAIQTQNQATTGASTMTASAGTD